MSAGDETLVFGIVFGVVFLLLCAAVLGVLSANGYKQKAEYKSPFAALKKHIINEDDPEADEEFARQRQRAEDRARRKLEQCELTFKDLLNPKHDHVTFGDLQLSYAVNNHAIVARSLGDRLVAVIGKSLIADAELGKDSDKDAVTWRGRHLTPAVVVTLDRHGYKSKLYIHGAHFERPGQGAKESKKRAIEFLEAVRCLKPTSTGGSGHH
jgi:hypothetical protein